MNRLLEIIITPSEKSEGVFVPTATLQKVYYRGFILSLALLGAITADAEQPTNSATISPAVTTGPLDLALKYDSPACGVPQPYRLYLPSAYDGTTAVPLLVALHGTGGNEAKYFDDPTYQSGIYKREAEKRGMAVLCPLGTDPLKLPTEWRGRGENNVLMAIEEVCRNYRIDENRIVCTGQSMGGTGTTYLCCRYPDLFAAGIPLASTYGHVTLVKNLKYVPMLYVQGGDDWPIYAQDGPIPLTAEIKKLDYVGRLWMIPGVGHNTMHVSTETVLDWALQQRRVETPREVVFRAYLPIHGRAYWTEIQELEQIGPFAEINARTEPDNRINVSITNARQFTLRPEPALLQLEKDLTVTVNGVEVFQGRCSADQEIRLTKSATGWNAETGPRHLESRTAYRTHKIGTAVTPPDWNGKAETTMGNWQADMMRAATGTDLAICTRNYFRGVPVKPGQELFLEDLIDWLRPTQQVLISFKLSGAQLMEILEENLVDQPAKQQFFLVHVSGCRYTFDRSRPAGQRIIETDLDPARTYSVSCEPHLLTRTDTLMLSKLRGQIEYEWQEPTTITAAWKAIAENDGRLTSKLDGRLRDITP